MNDGVGARAAASVAAAAGGGTARRNLAAGSHRGESQRPRGLLRGRVGGRSNGGTADHLMSPP